MEIVAIIVLVAVCSNLLGNLMTKFVEAAAQRRLRGRLGKLHWSREL